LCIQTIFLDLLIDNGRHVLIGVVSDYFKLSLGKGRPPTTLRRGGGPSSKTRSIVALDRIRYESEAIYESPRVSK
jgi:hypothetical protein